MDLVEFPGIREALKESIKKALVNRTANTGKIYGLVSIALALFAIADAIRDYTFRVTDSDR